MKNERPTIPEYQILRIERRREPVASETKWGARRKRYRAPWQLPRGDGPAARGPNRRDGNDERTERRMGTGGSGMVPCPRTGTRRGAGWGRWGGRRMGRPRRPER